MTKTEYEAHKEALLQLLPLVERRILINTVCNEYFAMAIDEEQFFEMIFLIKQQLPKGSV